VTVPLGVMRPILPRLNSVNHRLPSGPAVIPSRDAPTLMPAENKVTTPVGVMRPTELVMAEGPSQVPS
jgi:hypothetical protein